MWPFNRKAKVVREIKAGVWGKLVQQGVDVDTLTKDVRCVEKAGNANNGAPVTHVRIFKLSQAAQKGVEITGWEVFDRHPELVLFEGYINPESNQAVIEKRSA
ncbi:MAG: hypothetical protein A4E73_01747 [Syntrophaceae bacterium PtaU1.Bin231]|nr:MAG: hypothetical protein A4E73_01747 [Syntrophaceae bacterium PtaU1.Bin231]HOG18518.1 hypothetical protein [Syntrophales bacterium]